MVTLIIDDQIEKSKTYDGLILSLNIGGLIDLNMMEVNPCLTINMRRSTLLAK